MPLPSVWYQRIVFESVGRICFGEGIPVRPVLPIEGFSFRGGELFCESVPLSRLAEVYGTPLYVYSHAEIRRRFQELQAALSAVDHLICYAVKANGNLAVLRALFRMGAGADIVSGGELFRAVRAGVAPDRIVFAGVGKRPDEIELALKTGVRLFNVESLPEAEAIGRVAERLGVRAPVALRVNPDVDPETHAYTTTGKRGTKFGVDLDQALAAYHKMRELSGLEVRGIHAHIGSPVRSLEAYSLALDRLLGLLDRLRRDGFTIDTLNLGGGFPIRYREDEAIFTPEEYAKRLLPRIRESGCTLIVEPGRYLVGNAGVLLTEVIYRKETPEKTFLIVDAAMTELIRPALYGSFHHIYPVCELGSGEERVDVVGPVCETGDFFAKDRMLPRSQAGTLLAIFSAGAYGFVMASNYNARPRPAEVLVMDDRHYLVRERESYEDLIRGERIPEELWDDGREETER
ncbi:MAG: diaminopimelate decarboxylase [Candidatus Poribacteria bacterium]|nr:MAG: diaminopimelate decarboxylase [Candidatus Poribacteria bacterium]